MEHSYGHKGLFYSPPSSGISYTAIVEPSPAPITPYPFSLPFLIMFPLSAGCAQHSSVNVRAIISYVVTNSIPCNCTSSSTDSCTFIVFTFPISVDSASYHKHKLYFSTLVYLFVHTLEPPFAFAFPPLLAQLPLTFQRQHLWLEPPQSTMA